MLLHLTVGIRHDCLRDKAGNLVGDLLDIVDAVIYIVHLPLPGKLADDRLPDHLLVVLHDIGLDRLTLPRRLLENAHVADPHKAHVQRPRDRRRCQRQHIHILPDLLDLLLVTHAETLFLVDNQKPQILVLHVRGQESVRADHDIHQPFFEPLDGLLHLARRPKTRQHLHAHRKILHALHECVVMLLRQDRRRHEIRDLFPVLYGFERRADRDLRLSISHIAADQPVHDARTLHIALGRLDRKQLVARLLKREHLLKLLLPHSVLAEHKPLLLLPDCIQLHKILCDLVDGSLYLRFGLHPLLCAQLVQLRLFRRIGRGVFLDHVKPRRQHIEIAAVPVLDLDVILDDLVYLDLLDTFIDTESVILMDDIVPHLQVRKILDLLPLVRLFPLFALLLSKDIRLGDHDEL